MNEQEKKAAIEKYEEAKKKGVPFFPDIVFKDAVVAFIVFLILVALAYFAGAPLEARANPADTTYTPRPEWYFLFLFQLLKYFPGKLEFVGAVLVPTIVILALFLLPFLDSGPRRYFTKRPIVIAATGLIGLGIITLTGLAINESRPPVAAETGDPIAALYTANCAPCHGDSITVRPGTDLHAIIAQGNHQGMPAWGADIPSDQIDLLVGYILSPGGSDLFNQYCSSCHDVTQIVADNPMQIKQALDQGVNYPAHVGLNIPDWSTVMDAQAQSRLLNFLVAPDGARLYEVNCAGCHGQSIAFTGSEAELRAIITKGGMHLDMPAWKERLSENDINTLALYVVDPEANPQGAELFNTDCRICHKAGVPVAYNVADARKVISEGGPHQEMPVWGDILQPEALDALVAYTFQASQGSPIELGQSLYEANCAGCHGYFGEGGASPTSPGLMIYPISSADFLANIDDATLRTIITQGFPDFGMSPFGVSAGGPFDDKQIDAIIAHIRSWEANPPVTAPSTPSPTTGSTNVPTISGTVIYSTLCAQCHGANGEGGTGTRLNDPDYQKNNTDAQIYDAISQGNSSTSMIAWGGFLTQKQINELVAVIRRFNSQGASSPSFSNDILPLLQQRCGVCHGTSGSWNAASYNDVMTTGIHSPVVIPGDAANSLLGQKMTGTQTIGSQMPPNALLSNTEIQLIIDWINAGALDN